MKQQAKGFSLIEMLLVLVIVSSVIYMSMQYFSQRTDQLRIDKTAAQMQQILNAGMSYYIANGTASWPASIAAMQPTYLASSISTSPWGTTYTLANTSSSSKVFYVVVPLIANMTKGPQVAQIIAGKLPMAYVATDVGSASAAPTAGTCTAAGTCYVAAGVNIPGQNLNNATAVNFAGLYHHGGCVPVPTCPVDGNGNTMIPQIMVVPVSVSGLNDTNQAAPNNQNLYPINSFSAYATGGTSSSPGACQNDSTNTTTCDASKLNGPAPQSGKYWRVCLQVVTEKGDVALTTAATPANAAYPYNPWGGNVTLMAVTRCAINNEPAGSNFSVYTQ